MRSCQKIVYKPSCKISSPSRELVDAHAHLYLGILYTILGIIKKYMLCDNQFEIVSQPGCAHPHEYLSSPTTIIRNFQQKLLNFFHVRYETYVHNSY